MGERGGEAHKKKQEKKRCSDEIFYAKIFLKTFPTCPGKNAVSVTRDDAN